MEYVPGESQGQDGAQPPVLQQGESIDELLHRCATLRAESERLSQLLKDLAGEIWRMERAQKILRPHERLQKLPRAD